MDSLKIQDVFEPYYAGRKRFAVRRDKGLPAKADAGLAKKLRKRRPSKTTNLEIDPSTATGSTMEH